MLKQHVKSKVIHYYIDFDVYKLKAMSDHTKFLHYFF